MVVIDAETLIDPGQLLVSSRYTMSALDEITKEKQRLSEALARVDAQRDRLSAQLSELEATERVLARYSKSTQAKRRASGAATGAATPETIRSASAHRSGETRWRQSQLAKPRRSDPCPGNGQDTAGNRCRMQGGSPKPYRHRD